MQTKTPVVLIADDERNAVVLLTRVFERDGFAVESAKDGEQALQMAREIRPDLILLDVQMPKLNGFEVVERLREDTATSRIPIIFVTAAAREPSDVAQGLKLGADDYVRKPYNYHELLARARSKMVARQLEDRLQRRSEELEALVRIGGEFNQRLSLDELNQVILNVTRQELDAHDAELYLFDTERNLVLYTSTNGGNSQLDKPDTGPSQVFKSEEPMLISSNESFSSAAAPLKHHGKLVGILQVTRKNTDAYNENDLRLLRSIGEQASLAVRNAQLYAELQSYAQNLEAMVEARTQELQDAQALLVRNEKLAALGRLAAGVAHEVNNPLQPILNCLEVTIEDIESGQAVDSEVLRVAEKEVQRIKVIVSRLLDFARPSPSDISRFDMVDLVQEVLMLTRKQLERMNVELVTEMAEVPLIVGNPVQLKQVFLNLIINAMEAMPDGGRLNVKLNLEEDGVALSVKDTGIGMDSETIDRIFEPFYSTKEDGSGLGLAVSYGIVQGHGGEIRVDSKPGQGTRFTVWLPLSLE